MPEYPPTAIEAKMQGDVAIRVLIDNQGKVKDFEPRKGYVVLATAATKAISNWQYKPFSVNPGQLGVESLIVLTFSLDGSPSVKDGSPELVDMLDTTLRVRKVCFASGVLQGNLIHRVDPAYPQTAKIAHVQGDVVIEVTIDKTGSISRATVLKGPTLLTEAALAAVKQWKYRPYLQDGNPVEVESTVTVKFHM
jgi:TonB family protein